jgi:hypothetical protein
VERDRDRLVYLFGEEVLVDLDDYDLGVEAEVMEVVERFLSAPAGPPFSGARAAVRAVAVRQILDDDPPETWRVVCGCTMRGWTVTPCSATFRWSFRRA